MKALATFFAALVAAGDNRVFHPHPLTRQEAEERCGYAGLDLYYVLGAADRVLAYGMLRGWDAGFEVPSLGLAVDPQARGCGFGRLLLDFLHTAAARRGAESVRLKVDRDNEPARRLYERAGYTLLDGPANELVGVLRVRR
ncbi:MAG TPA: GNAT family N-acetyltransferase [Gaiellaceae bacterium]|nr:GNAT family N-acetyltransferase [Gaiellaceae bacterium]